MSQADGNTILERMELAYGSNSFKFRINPQSIKYEYPQRQAVNKTQSAIVVQDFNSGVQKVTISGTTGSPTRGGEKGINQLRNFLSNYANSPVNYGNKPKVPLTFLNHTEDFGWYTILKDWSVERSVDKPLMWDYTIELIVLGDALGRIPGKKATNEVTSWLYDKKRYKSSKGAAITTASNSAYIGPNMADGKSKKSIMSNSKTGKVRAARTLGVI